MWHPENFHPQSKGFANRLCIDIFAKKTRKYPSNGFAIEVCNLVNLANRGWGFVYMATSSSLCIQESRRSMLDSWRARDLPFPPGARDLSFCLARAKPILSVLSLDDLVTKTQGTGSELWPREWLPAISTNSKRVASSDYLPASGKQPHTNWWRQPVRDDAGTKIWRQRRNGARKQKYLRKMGLGKMQNGWKSHLLRLCNFIWDFTNSLKCKTENA